MGGDKPGIGYTGHLQDEDLGLTYMQARYYDPLIGRFYADDPIGFRDVHSFNRYAYGNNNPYKYADPDGKAAESFFVAGKMYENTMQAVSNAWPDMKQSLDSQVANSTPDITVTAEDVGNIGDASALLASGSLALAQPEAAIAFGVISTAAGIVEASMSENPKQALAVEALSSVTGAKTVGVLTKTALGAIDSVASTGVKNVVEAAGNQLETEVSDLVKESATK